jgi:chromate transporter
VTHPAPPRDGFLAILLIFLRLGLTSFGGPVAHLGYFRTEFVARRQWLSEAAYADLVALAQFLPGPASSQTGFALGMLRGGLAGGIAAWIGFTLPSALVMVAAAYGVDLATGGVGAGVVHGLKLVAVAVVAQAVWGMARTLTPDFKRLVVAAIAAVMVSILAGSFGQIGAIVFGALAGLVFCRGLHFSNSPEDAFAPTRKTGLICLALFFLLLLLLPWLAAATRDHALTVFSAFYRSGALVFGGGHVVLPLLREAVVAPGWISQSDFLAGYGAAQAVPGPLFTVAAYLGAMLKGDLHGGAGAALALTGIFLPGILILMGTLPFWHGLRARPLPRAALAGVNAAVVGILAAALYDPLWKSAVGDWRDVALAASGFLLLAGAKAPPWMVVLGLTAACFAYP